MRLRLVVWTSLGIICVGACAGMQQKETLSFESALEAAGFVRKLADTDAKLAELEKMPQEKLVQQDYKGQPVYIYADAKGCKCLYAGSDEDYENLQQAIHQQTVSNEERAALDQAPPFTNPQYVDVEAYGGTDPLPWW